VVPVSATGTRTAVGEQGRTLYSLLKKEGTLVVGSRAPGKVIKVIRVISLLGSVHVMPRQRGEGWVKK
jgi:hypothetical protein